MWKGAEAMAARIAIGPPARAMCVHVTEAFSVDESKGGECPEGRGEMMVGGLW